MQNKIWIENTRIKTMRSIEIGRIQKSKSVSIVFEILEIEEQFFVNIREYVKSNKFTGFTKKGYVFNIGYLDNAISFLQDIANFISSKDWKEKFEETYNDQIEKINEGEKRIDKIYSYLNSNENKPCDATEIREWIKYCYESKQFKLAIRVFDSIDKQNFSSELYMELKKIVEICKIKSE